MSVTNDREHRPQPTAADSDKKPRESAASVQLKQQLAGLPYAEQAAALAPGGGAIAGGPPVQLSHASGHSAPGALQAKGSEPGGANARDVHAVASSGLNSGGGTLPHVERIQSSFGRYDVSAVQAHVGGAASQACGQLGAAAYASGGHVAFKGSPDLHTAAHEAAHVVQQSAGVQLKDGIGQAGDAYERHADAVAGKVVAGESAEGMLASMAGPTQTSGQSGTHASVMSKSDSVQCAPAGDGDPVVQFAPEPASTGAVPVNLHRYTVGHRAAKYLWIGREGNEINIEDRARETLAPYSAINVDRARAEVHAASNYWWARSPPTNNDGYIEQGNVVAAHHFGGAYWRLTTGVGTHRIWNHATNAYESLNYTNADQIAGSTYWALDVTGGFRIFNTATAEFTTPLSAGGLKGNLVPIYTRIIQTEGALPGGVTIKKKDKMFEKIEHDAVVSAGHGIATDPHMYDDPTTRITDRIIPRVNHDIAQIRGAFPAITAHHNLTGVEFTGADFHKHGQQTFFLYFDTAPAAPGGPIKIVYKPANLNVDQTVFNTANSLAHALDAGGNQIAQYTILANVDARGAAGHGESYGYEQFVQEGLPTTAAQLRGIWRSIGASCALTYLAGFEDVHEENVLVLPDKIQLIDMEATSGIFTTFNRTLWTSKALPGKIRPKLMEAARAMKALGVHAAPATGTAVGDARGAFQATLATAGGGAFNAEWATHRNALAATRARIVPVATAELKKGLSKVPGKTLGQWRTWIDAAPADNNAYVTECMLGQTSTRAFVKRCLQATGAYNALRRGDVPFYERDLSNDNVFDEENNPINSAGCSMVAAGRGINDEMNDRRGNIQANAGNPDLAAGYVAFVAEMVPLITALSDDLVAATA